MSAVLDQQKNNPFAGSQIAARPTGNAVAQSDQQRAIAEVQAAMMIARMNPRDPIVAMDRILNACARPTLADSAVYTYSRGGSDVSGPSIRLAEAMAQAWGNMQFGIRELDQRNGESTVQAFAWDVETNTRREVTFQVPHVRYTRQGSKRLEDPRDIYEMVANQGARRLRACILAVIPGDVTEAAVIQCETTMKTKADTSPEAMQKMVSAFEPFGVTREQIEKRIQRRLDAIQPAQVVSLKKIYASLRDGMSVAADWFEAIESAPADGAQTTTDALKDKLRNRKPGAHDDPLPAIQENDTSAGDVYAAEKTAIAQCETMAQFIGLMNTMKPKVKAALKAELEAKQTALQPRHAVTFAQVEEKLRNAPDIDLLDAAADWIQDLPADQQTDAGAIYRECRMKLEGA